MNQMARQHDEDSIFQGLLPYQPSIPPALIQFAVEKLTEWNEEESYVPAEWVEEVILAKACIYEAIKAGQPHEEMAERYREFALKLPTLFLAGLIPGLQQAFPIE